MKGKIKQVICYLLMIMAILNTISPTYVWAAVELPITEVGGMQKPRR